MSPKRLVLLVEGQGDVEAAPILLKRLLGECSAFDAVFLDPNPLRVGGYPVISAPPRGTPRSPHRPCPAPATLPQRQTEVEEYGEWRRHLRNAAKRANLGACLLLLDGDSNRVVAGQPFCAAVAAGLLAAEAKKVGAGRLFSVAIVFACLEFESWLIAGAESLVGTTFSDGRREILKLHEAVPENPEKAPRNAKGWFNKTFVTGYRPTRDQAELTRLVDLQVVRARRMRSFQRLEAAIDELVTAVRSGNHVVTPEC